MPVRFRSRRIPFITSAVLLFLSGVPMMYGQQTLGSILGTLSDSSGRVITGATVTLTDQQTGLARTFTTSGNGSYAFYNLPIDTYTLTAAQTGFQQGVYPNLQVQADRTITLNPKLPIGSAAESVTVNATPLLNATDTTNGYVLDHDQIQNVPLATGSFTQLAVLAPGVSAELLSGTGTQTGLGNQPIWANGQRDTSNTFLFNGVDTSNLFNGKSTSQVSSGRVVPNTGEGFGPVNNPNTGTSVYDAIGEAIPTPAPEFIEEIRVNTSMYDAQQGSTSGVHIDLSTQSGTKQYHGQAYFYRGTDWINAAPFYYKQANEVPASSGGPLIPNSEVVPQLHRFTAGATLGGPILKDKLFGFIGYNAIRVTDQSTGISTIKTPLGLTDNNRSAAGIAALLTANSALTSPQKPIVYNASQIDPAALNLLQFKLPNGAYLIPSQTVAQSTYGITTLFGKPSFDADQAVADLDLNISPRDVLSAKYFYQHDPSIAPFTNSTTSGFAQHLDSGAHVASLTNAINVSPRINWTQVVGFAREKAYSTDDQALSPTQAGINLFGSGFFPGLSIRNFSASGNTLNLGNASTFNRTGVFQNRISPQTDIIFSLGKHTLTAGANYDYTQLNVRNRQTNAANISFSNFASFAQGNVRTGSGSQLLQGASNRYYRANQVGSYVQDKFQASPHLSLTAGLRYDWNGPLTEKYGNLFNFDASRYVNPGPTGTFSPTSDGFIIAGNNSTFSTPGVSNSTLQGRQWGFGPRIGFAYSPAMFQEKMVVRGGFGIYYDRGEYFTYLSPGAGSGISGPFGVTQEPPFVIPVSAASGARLDNPFGTTKPTPPNGNPAAFVNYLPNLSQIAAGAQTFPFGSYDIHNKLPYTENFAFDIQYQPSRDVAIDIGYVGNIGRHGVIPVPFNQPKIATLGSPVNGEIYSYGQQATDLAGNPLTTEPYDTYDGGNTDLRTPFPGYSPNSVDYLAEGASSYNALQLHVEKRMSHGLQVGFSYTWSHSLDEQSGLGLFYNGNNPLDLGSGYGNSDFDRTHITNFIYTYQFPKLTGQNRIIEAFSNGWQLSGLTVFQSGQPFSVEDYSGTIGSQQYGYGNDGITNPIIPLAPGYTPQTARTGHSGAFVGDDPNNLQLVDLYFNPNVFNVATLAPGTNGVPACGKSTAGAPVCDVVETTFGSGNRNIFRQSFQKRADISLIKDTQFGERVRVRYTFDVYNLTNSSSFDIPGNSIALGQGNAQVPYDPTQSAAANIGQQYKPLTTPAQAQAQGLGQVTNTIGGPRNIQMSLHVIY